LHYGEEQMIELEIVRVLTLPVRRTTRALAAQESVLGPDHPDLVPALAALADLKLKDKRCAETPQPSSNSWNWRSPRRPSAGSICRGQPH
jgi:hypothetical protein